MRDPDRASADFAAVYTVLPFAQSMWVSSETHDCRCLQVMKMRDRDERITRMRKSAQQAVAKALSLR